MSNYTQADLDSVKAAIIALASGKRATLVRVGDMVTEFASADLEELRKLQTEIEASVLASTSTTPRRRFVRTTTRKGI